MSQDWKTKRFLTTGELADFMPGKRATVMAYIRAEIARGHLQASHLSEDDPTSPHLIDIESARKWLTHPKRGSKSKMMMSFNLMTKK